MTGTARPSKGVRREAGSEGSRRRNADSTNRNPLEWILLTNVSTEDLVEARERVEWYGHRWIIEEFHKAQKSGCGIELPQFTTQKRLEPMIALLSVVAVELLRLRNASRSPQTRDRPASEHVSKTYVDVLSAWRHRQVRDLSVHEFYMALARLGGHQNRRHDHPPGWLVLSRGWAKLESMAIGRGCLEASKMWVNLRLKPLATSARRDARLPGETPEIL